MFFNKKKSGQLLDEDVKLISYNSERINVLLEISKNEEFNKKLKSLKEELHYLTPSIQSEVLNFDKKIKNNIDDLKVSLTKNPMADVKDENLLQQIKILVAERNSNIK